MSKKMLTKTIGAAIIGSGLIVSAVQAQTLSSAQCTGPTVVATFSASVAQATGQTSAAVESFTEGLTALKFKKSAQASDVVALDVYNGAWSSGNTVYTAYVTLPQYREANSWDVWPIQVTATVSGSTTNVACQ